MGGTDDKSLLHNKRINTGASGVRDRSTSTYSDYRAVCVVLLTEHPEAELLVALARLVPGDAGVLPLVQLGHLHDCHLRAVLVEAVLILRVQDHPVATTTGG